MAFIQCECGSKIELSSSAIRVTCPGCGKRFTVPQIEEPSTEFVATAATPKPAASSAAGDSQPQLTPVPHGISATMMQDLPVVTQFENHYAQSILAVGMFNSQVGSTSMDQALAGGAAVAPLLAAAAGVSTCDTPAANRSTRNSKRRGDKTSPSEFQDVQLQPGQFLLERYEVGRKIGQGGMSSVYEAHDHVRDEQVALKILLPHLAANPKLQERFMQEGRLSSNFSHPNIARVYDLHQTDAHILLSMELLHGSTLRHDMHRRKTQGQSYRPAEVVSILRQVCEALAVVHASDIVHRDLKPENLWLGLDGTVKVMDFGIARDSVRGALTTGPRGSGTPYYIAPEQLSASPTLDHRADQYSLAIIAYELLTGELPQGAVAPPHIKHPSIPKKLSQAIFRGLNADPAQRHADIRQFQSALDYQRRMPLLAKLAIGTAAVGALGASGYAFERWGMPLFETKVSPVWSEIAAQQVVEGETVRFSVRHPESTLSGKGLQYKLLSDAPLGAEIDTSSGEFQWTPNEAQGPKDYTFNIMAIVEQEGRPPVIEERPVKISVKEAFNPPVFDTPESITTKENAALETSIVANDPNEPKIGLVYELVDPPAGMTIDQRTGLIQWTPREEMGSTHHSVPVRVALAGDDHRDIATVRKLNVHVEEAIDKLLFTSSDRLSAEVNVPVTLRVLTRDPNTPTLNTYYRLKGGERLGMVLEPQTGELTWTPSEEVAGKNFDVTIEACWDGAGKTEVVGSQLIKVAVAEYEPKEEEAPKIEPAPQPTLPGPSAPVVASSIGGGFPGGAPSTGTCPTGGNAGGGNSGGGGGSGGPNGGGNCPSGGGSGQGNCPNGNGPTGNGPFGGIIVDIVGAAIAAHDRKEQAGRVTTPANNGSTSGSATGGSPLTNRLPIDKLPLNKVPLNKVPLNRLPLNQLPGNVVPGNPLPTNALPTNKLQPHSVPTFPGGNTGISGGRIGQPPARATMPTFPQPRPTNMGNNGTNIRNGNLNHQGNSAQSARGGSGGQALGNLLKHKLQQDLRGRQGGNSNNRFRFKN